MEGTPSPLPSPSSCSEPINAIPLRWYPPSAFTLAPQDYSSPPSPTHDQSCFESAKWPQASASFLSDTSVEPEPRKDNEDITGSPRNEILLFGFRIRVSHSDSSLSVATVADHQFVQNQQQSRGKKNDGGSSCVSRKRIRLFGTWISEEETACQKPKLELQETSKVIKKRAYTRRTSKKRAVNEQNGGTTAAGAYKENIGELVVEKVLTRSDTDQSSRLLLSRETVERRLIPILNENYPQAPEHCKSPNGLRMEIFDADTDDNNDNSYTLVLKQWVTRSFVFTRNWKKDFVKRRNLKEEDQIGLFWDQGQRRFNFSVKQIRS